MLGDPGREVRRWRAERQDDPGRDVRVSAGWACAALTSSGYGVDFTIDTLGEVDRFFADQTRTGRVRRRSVLGRDLDGRLDAVGAYVGETIRRAAGGVWQVDLHDPENGRLLLLLDDGARLHPLRDVRRMFEELCTTGTPTGVAVYGALHGAASQPAARAELGRG